MYAALSRLLKYRFVTTFSGPLCLICCHDMPAWCSLYISLVRSELHMLLVTRAFFEASFLSPLLGTTIYRVVANESFGILQSLAFYSHDCWRYGLVFIASAWFTAYSVFVYLFFSALDGLLAHLILVIECGSYFCSAFTDWRVLARSNPTLFASAFSRALAVLSCL